MHALYGYMYLHHDGNVGPGTGHVWRQENRVIGSQWPHRTNKNCARVSNKWKASADCEKNIKKNLTHTQRQTFKTMRQYVCLCVCAYVCNKNTHKMRVILWLCGFVVHRTI